MPARGGAELVAASVNMLALLGMMARLVRRPFLANRARRDVPRVAGAPRRP